MSSRALGTRRAWVLVALAGVAAVVAVVLLALLVAALWTGRGAGPALADGLAAYGAAVLAAGLLVLARAGAVGRTDATRARALCARCTVGGLFAVVAVLVAGGVAVTLTGSDVPMRGSAAGGALLVPLVVLAVWLRRSLRAAQVTQLRAAQRTAQQGARPRRRGTALRSDRPPADRPPRSGGGGESEPGRAAGAR
jgi:hypothetical protein